MRHADQRGFALLELMVAAIVMTLLAVWASNALVHRMKDADAQGKAVWMLSIKQAALAYLDRHAPALVHADHSSALSDEGYASWFAPTLAELKSTGLLSRGFPEQIGVLGAGIRVLRHGTCPGTQCRVEALIYADMPFLNRDGHGIDEQMVAQWMMASNGWGGSVTVASPQWVRGPAFAFANPSWEGQALPPGTVALAITAEQLRDVGFLRVGDVRDPDFRGSASIQGDIGTRADLRVGRYLHLETEEVPLSPCSHEGAIAREPQAGLLICRDNSWRPAGRGSAGGFSVNQLRGCKNSAGASTANPVTHACSCPDKSYIVQISDSGPQPFPEGRTTGFLCVD